MKDSFKYILEPYKGENTRYRCPSCNHKTKTFTLYINTETGEHIANDVGRCGRENKCGYHYSPKQYFTDNNLPLNDRSVNRIYRQLPPPKPEKPISFIPKSAFEASLKNYPKNNFIIFLINHFGIEITNELIKKYNIGTSKKWNGATIFWQLDADLNIRTGKIMLFNANTGRRVKEPIIHISWVHTKIKDKDFNWKQCLFGEHLINQNDKPIAIVESEKTAIITSVFFPQLNWLATGSKSNLSYEKLKVLKDRKVILFPDSDAFDKWSQIAKDIAPIMKVKVSDLLNRKLTEEEILEGYDIADYLIQYPISEFLDTNKTDDYYNTRMEALPQNSNTINIPQSKTTNDWSDEVNELESFFQNSILPTNEIRLNPSTKIIDVNKFIKSHIAVLRGNEGKNVFYPFLERLRMLKKVLLIQAGEKHSEVKGMQ